MLGEAVEWEDGILKVTGVVRGAALSANRLVHLPNFGDYQITNVRWTQFFLFNFDAMEFVV
jgi:pre-rRNA-processing protein TSR1